MTPYGKIILGLVVFFILLAANVAQGEVSIGVREGDWIEYDVITNGTPPEDFKVKWARMEILDVQGTRINVNVTTQALNGTLSSLVMTLNLQKGEIGAWFIIPAGLNPGDSFHDESMGRDVAVEGEEQLTYASAIRTITNATTLERLKRWDKSTGVFVESIDVLDNYFINATAISTNMWSPQILGLDQTIFYTLVSVVIILAVLILSAIILTVLKKNPKRFILRSLSQGKIAVLTVVVVILVEIGTILFFPFHDIGMSFAEFNLIMQTFWTVLVLVSMWFRKKGNYFVHEITLLVVMCVWLVGFSAVIFMDPLSFTSLEAFSNTPLRLIMNILHGVFSVPALVFGIWLVALWRPESTTFPAKTKRLAQLTTIFWIPSYVVGVLDFMVLHTTFFG